MVIQCSEDVLLQKVAQGLEELVACYPQMRLSSSSSWQSSCWPSSSSSSWQGSCWPYERLLLLQCRSKDVLSEFSRYYCLRLLLDNDSPLATYFIDLFYQLEWLLEALLLKSRTSSSGVSVDNMPLTKDLYDKINGLLCCFKPAVNSCRYLFAISRSSSFVGSQWLSAGKEKRREGKAYRDFSMDDFRGLTKMLSFVNLDECSKDNKVQLGKRLGSGGYADVYEGNFVTRNNTNHSQQITGEPVAVKVFRNIDIGTDSAGSQFFDQMEKMVKLYGSADNTISMTEGERLLSEELWKLVSAKHPNIVTARGYIGKRSQGESGLVMELMNTSLEDYLVDHEKVKEPLKELEMVDLMLEIAKGMRFLHECDLVHKDLKPQNVLLRSHKQLGRWENCPAMEVKLADFGLTQRFVQDVQKSANDTTRAGTYCYMAPEVLQSAGYQASYQDKVDVFSFGTTCFNILTCEVPGALEFTRAFSKASSAEFYEAVKSNDWRAGVKGKPEYLIDLIARCWAFDPSQRPTFATICSLLQRAMLCILSPPVINVTTLSNFQQTSKHSLLNLYKTITWSADVHYQVIGTRMMESCLEEFTRDINMKGPMTSNLSEDAAHFVQAWSKITGTATSTEESVHVSISKLFAALKKKVTLKRWEEPFSAIDEDTVP